MRIETQKRVAGGVVGRFGGLQKDLDDIYLDSLPEVVGKQILHEGHLRR